MPKDILSLMGKGKITKPAPKTGTTTTPLDILSNKLKTVEPKKWKTTGTHLIKKIPTEYKPTTTPVKIAAFDLDSTLIESKSGYKFGTGPDDWKWLNDQVLDKLLDYYKHGYVIVILTNQGAVIVTPGSKSYSNFTYKLDNVTKKLDQHGIKDVFVYAAPMRPRGKKNKHLANLSSEELHKNTRKPEIGMWESFLEDLGNPEVDYDNSFFVGDAAGRAKDFSDSDLVFSKNMKLKFHTPEELFTKEDPSASKDLPK